MGVRRKVSRKKMLNVTTTDRLGPQPLSAKAQSKGGGPFEQVIHPHPGKTAKGYFEPARPLYANRLWILDVPVPPFAESFPRKFPNAAEPLSFGPRHPTLATLP